MKTRDEQSFNLRLYLFIVVFCLGFIGYGIYTYYAINHLRVNGPMYERVIHGKDLIADILPPPMFIVEPYLLAFQAVSENNRAARDHAIDRFSQLRQDYHNHAASWEQKLADGPIKEKLLVQSRQSAYRFFAIVENEVFPALQEGQYEHARNILNDRAAAVFFRHRDAIVEVVKLTEERNREVISSSNRAISILIWMHFLVCLLVIAIVIALCIRLIGKIRTEVSERKRAQTLLLELEQEKNHQLEEKNVALKNALDEVSTLQNQMIRQEKMASVGLLAGGMAHDFNNLLTSILGNIERAVLHSEEPDVKEILQHSQAAGKKAIKLGEQLLILSQAHWLSLHSVPVDGLLRRVTGALISDPAISVTYRFGESLQQVWADMQMLEKAFAAIITNAAEAMPQGGRLLVSAENMMHGDDDGVPLRPGDYVSISIEDTGRGIPHDSLARVFEPYFTTKDAYSENGLGLGLSLCYSIIQKHDGLITVESEVGKGTVVRVYLPVAPQ